MIDKNFMSLDLEFNQPTNTIIQIGFVIGNLKTGDILEKHQINLHTNEKISNYITQLTNITQKDVDNGIHIKDAYEIVKHYFIKYQCFRNPITWGGGDSEALRDQLKLNDEVFLFGRRWIDCKTLYISQQFANEEKHQAGLAKAMNREGLQFKGRKHTADDDAENTFVMYRHLLKKFKKIKDGHCVTCNKETPKYSLNDYQKFCSRECEDKYKGKLK